MIALPKQIAEIAEEIFPAFQFIVDEKNKRVFEQLWMYMNREEKFTQNGKFSLEKGITLVGSTGRGKDIFMKLMSAWFHKYRKEMAFKTFLITAPPVELESDQMDFFRATRKENHYYSDIGHALEMRITGRGRDALLTDLIVSHRYPLFHSTTLSGDGVFTHFSTNIPEEDLKTVFLDTTISRMLEMSNQIPLIGPDRRAKTIILPRKIQADTTVTQGSPQESYLQLKSFLSDHRSMPEVWNYAAALTFAIANHEFKITKRGKDQAMLDAMEDVRKKAAAQTNTKQKNTFLAKLEDEKFMVELQKKYILKFYLLTNS